MLAEQAGWRDQTFNWFGKQTIKIHKCVIKRDRKSDLKMVQRQRERERKESRKRGSDCQTATEGSPMAHLKNEG